MIRILGGLAVASAIGSACAQAPAADTATTMGTTNPVAVEATATAPLPAPCRYLCAGQVIDVEVVDAIRSDRNHVGDRFTLRLATPIQVDGVEIVPAGTTGVGEVVHAARSRASGIPGELLLAARSLDHMGRTIPLRGMKLSARGKDQINTTLALTYVVAPLSLFVHGGEVEIPPGTRAIAKIAQDIEALATVPHAEADATGPQTASPQPTETTTQE